MGPEVGCVYSLLCSGYAMFRRPWSSKFSKVQWQAFFERDWDALHPHLDEMRAEETKWRHGCIKLGKVIDHTLWISGTLFLTYVIGFWHWLLKL